jgi:hypothetical protein
MEEKNTEIRIRMDSDADKVFVDVSGKPNDLANALICGGTDVAREIAAKLTNDERKLFAGEIAAIALSIDPDAFEEEEA